MNARSVVQAHLWRERLDVMLAVMVPFVIMVVSGWSNAWGFAGGKIDGGDFNFYMALVKGVFLEALIYACFKLVKNFVVRKSCLLCAAALIPLSVGMSGMIVSAGFGIGWASQSGEMQHLLSSVAQYMPAEMVGLFKLSLGLLFPIAVGSFALFDVTHLVEEMLKSSHLDNKALKVHRSEMHRTEYLKAQKKSGVAVREKYQSICDTDAQRMVDSVRNGDLSFGAQELAAPAYPSITRISPVAASPAPALSAPAPAAWPNTSQGNPYAQGMPPLAPNPFQMPQQQRPY